LKNREQKRTAVLLVNLGTPLTPQPKDVFHYLNEFLTDRRVIDLPWLRRQCLVRGIIVPFRFQQSAKQYQRLWTKNGSPLLVHGKAVQEKLQQSLGNRYIIILAMRYQFPSIQDALKKIENEQVDELIILPLFPQYASATTGSVHQKVMEYIQEWLYIPQLTFINSYFDHPAFIQAFCERASQYLLDSYDHILFSFHGLPESHIRKIDKNNKCLTSSCCKQICSENHFCYKAQCYATARAIASQMRLNEQEFSICFQSRLGKDSWIKPYTLDVLHECVSKSYQKLLVFCPSFVCDCLETTYEIATEYQQEFVKLGGQEIQLVEGLNSHPKWIQALHQLIIEHTKVQSSQIS
jgi:ferrochelatase